jgi:hypothetical protein
MREREREREPLTLFYPEIVFKSVPPHEKPLVP